MTQNILKVDSSGLPIAFIDPKKALKYFVKDKILSQSGVVLKKFHGGISKETKKESQFNCHSIIMIKDKHQSRNFFNNIPSIDSKILFLRDLHICAYCGDEFKPHLLNIDHIISKYNNGSNTWNNVITSCKICNAKKANKTLKQANMNKHYDEYVPTRFEFMILEQISKGSIYPEQVEYITRMGKLHTRFLTLLSKKNLI